MKIYTVINDETDYREDFHSLTAAKQAMREHNAQGFITKVWSNGDWEPAGEITLKGSNKNVHHQHASAKEKLLIGANYAWNQN